MEKTMVVPIKRESEADPQMKQASARAARIRAFMEVVIARREPSAKSRSAA
jgi:hypothetical protein